MSEIVSIAKWLGNINILQLVTAFNDKAHILFYCERTINLIFFIITWGKVTQIQWNTIFQRKSYDVTHIMKMNTIIIFNEAFKPLVMRDRIKLTSNGSRHCYQIRRVQSLAGNYSGMYAWRSFSQSSGKHSQH